jgi:hypothetical protein
VAQAVVERVLRMDIDRLTPLEALNALAALRAALQHDRASAVTVPAPAMSDQP